MTDPTRLQELHLRGWSKPINNKTVFWEPRSASALSRILVSSVRPPGLSSAAAHPLLCCSVELHFCPSLFLPARVSLSARLSAKLQRLKSRRKFAVYSEVPLETKSELVCSLFTCRRLADAFIQTYSKMWRNMKTSDEAKNITSKHPSTRYNATIPSCQYQYDLDHEAPCLY